MEDPSPDDAGQTTVRRSAEDLGSACTLQRVNRPSVRVSPPEASHAASRGTAAVGRCPRSSPARRGRGESHRFPPTAGAAGRHPARHGGGKLRLEAEQVRRLFARSTLLLPARLFLLVALQCQKPNVSTMDGFQPWRSWHLGILIKID